jgi:hypothetical protein
MISGFFKGFEKVLRRDQIIGRRQPNRALMSFDCAAKASNYQLDRSRDALLPVRVG